MTSLRSFVAATLSGGLFVVLPVVLVVLIIGETLDLVIGLAAPIADLIPGWSLALSTYPELQAAVVLLLASFAVGLAMRSRAGAALGRVIERVALDPIPGYTMLRRLSRRAAGDAREAALAPALLAMPLDGQTPALIVEELADGRATVFLPMAPTPGVGRLEIVDRSRLTPLDVPIGRFMDGFFQMGVGFGALIPPDKRP